MSDIENLISEIPLFREAKTVCEPLGFGMSNTTYKVVAEKTPYVLRINGPQHKRLKLDTREEAEIIRKAHEIKIAPNVYAYGDGYLVTEFLHGRTLSRLNARRPEYIVKIAELLRKAHSIKDVSRKCSPFDLIEKYIGGRIPDGLAPLLTAMENVRRRTPLEAFCHNDATCMNIIDDGGNLRLVDWELSGRGSFVFFDLAEISLRCAYTPREDRLLLDAYFGKDMDENLLRDGHFMVKLRENAFFSFEKEKNVRG